MDNQPDRSTYIGSSDAAAILGVSKWTTAYDVWLRKVAAASYVEDESKARIFKRGKRLEPYVIDMMAEEHDLWITGRNKRYTHTDYDFLQCEIDAEEEDFEGNIRNVEIKTVSPFAVADWGEPWTDEIPTYYMAQVQFALAVTGRKQTVVAALIGADELRIYIVNRDEEIIQHILNECVQFWNNNVLAGVAPAPQTGDDVDKWLKRFNGLTLEADADTMEKMKFLHEVKREIKQFEVLKEDLEGQLKLKLAGGIPTLTTAAPGTTPQVAIVDASGKILMTWNEQSASRLDAEKVKEYFPELHKSWMKSSTFRVLRLKEKNL